MNQSLSDFASLARRVNEHKKKTSREINKADRKHSRCHICRARFPTTLRRRRTKSAEKMLLVLFTERQFEEAVHATPDDIIIKYTAHCSASCLTYSILSPLLSFAPSTFAAKIVQLAAELYSVWKKDREKA